MLDIAIDVFLFCMVAIALVLCDVNEQRIKRLEVEPHRLRAKEGE